MADKTQFEKMHDTCAVCEAMLPDAVDGALSPAEQQAFDRHVATCVECAAELASARRGAAWLGMLKGNPPEPPAALLAKILAGTTGAVAKPVMMAETAPQPAMIEPSRGWGTQPSHGWANQIEAFRQRLSETFSFNAATSIFQPRLAMTAAMAFFSIALTLNLAGVRLGNLRASDFTPGGIRRTVADASASMARTFQNNPTVYKVESRVSELREDDAPHGNNVSNDSSR